MRKINMKLTPFDAFDAISSLETADGSTRRRARAAIINGGKVANDEAIKAWMIAA